MEVQTAASAPTERTIFPAEEARALFQKCVSFSDDVYRNIVSLKCSEDLFDDLYEDTDPDLYAIAVACEMRVKSELSPGVIQRGFHYNTAILYPFEKEPFLSTRYSDGRYGVWYGSLDERTTIYETAYHFAKFESATDWQIEGLSDTVVRERAVYKIHCQSILIDLRSARFAAKLTTNDYYYTQKVGEHLQREGHPGIITPSARSQGDNIVMFNPDRLSNPSVFQYYRYVLSRKENHIRIEPAGGAPWHIKIDSI